MIILALKSTKWMLVMTIVNVHDFITWLEDQGIQLRTETHTSEGIVWTPLFKDVDILVQEFLNTQS
jgi:hypothetical protein